MLRSGTRFRGGLFFLFLKTETEREKASDTLFRSEDAAWERYVPFSSRRLFHRLLFFSYLSLACLLACLLYVGSNARQRCRVRERENQRDRSLWWGAGARKTVTHRLSGGNRNVLPPSGAESVSSSFSLSVAVKVFFFLLLFSSLFCVCIPLVRPPLSRRPAAVCGSANALIQSTLVRSFVRSLARSTHPLIHQSESHFIDRLFVACSALACVRAGEGNDDHDHDESSA